MLLHLAFVVAHLRARFGRDEGGAGLVEYTLLVGLIALVCVVAVGFLGDTTNSLVGKGGSGLR